MTTGTPSPVSGAQGVGTLTGSAGVYYYALLTVSGGSESVYGGLFAFVRSDGSVFEMKEEASANTFDAAKANYGSEADIQSIWNQAITSFAGN